MQISQMFKRKPCVFSIECFPPKQTANFDKMKDNLRTMRTLNPDFISVTYGAGGSTGGVSTVEVAEFLKNDLNVEPLAHMICMGSDKAKAAQLLDQLNAAGVMPIVKRSQIERTVALSSASLPSEFTRMISRYQDDPESLYAAGIDYAVQQLRDLIEGGADGVHLYAMNDAKVAAAVYEGIKDLL